jgi:hypothetical protein
MGHRKDDGGGSDVWVKASCKRLHLGYIQSG